MLGLGGRWETTAISYEAGVTSSTWCDEGQLSNCPVTQGPLSTASTALSAHRMSASVVSTHIGNNGSSVEDLWDIVVLLNKELKTTKLSLESSLEDAGRLREENENLRAQHPHLERIIHGAKPTTCARGSCKSADEVKTLKQLRNELEDALAESREVIARKTGMVETLRQELEIARRNHAKSKKSIPKQVWNILTTYRVMVFLILLFVFVLDNLGVGECHKCHNRPTSFIPEELRPVLARLTSPDVSDRPKTSKPCVPYRQKEMVEIPRVSVPVSLENAANLGLQSILTATNANPILFCASRLLWCTEPYQHAFFLFPASIYRPRGEEPWQTFRKPSYLRGTTREVFYSAWQSGRIEVHYAGTYICKQVGRLSPSEYMQCSSQLRKDLCRAAVEVPLASDEIARRKEIARKEFERGTQEVGYIFLQCVGFNNQFYRAMRRELKPTTKGRKRAAADDEPEHRRHKKVKRE